MTVAKGKKALYENDPNFSDQALENAINNLKIGWVAKSIQLDTAITDSTVLTSSQKNDLKDEIDNVPHLNMGRYLGDLLRHTKSIIDGTIIPVNDVAENPTPTKFFEIVGEIQSLQELIPSLTGESAESKNRGVNDHVGTLNNKFLETEDSSLPTFTSLEQTINFIDRAGLATDTLYQTAIDDLKTFVVELTGDSTDFQTSLDNRSNALQTAATNFDTALQTHPYDLKRNQLITDRNAINTQVSLESANIKSIRDFTETLAEKDAFTLLARDPAIRKLLTNVAQNTNWKSYYENYETNFQNLNPIYDDISRDADRNVVVEEVLRSRGLPDVIDSLDVPAVANKALLGPYGLDSKGFGEEGVTGEVAITEFLTQLRLSTIGSVYQKSERLLKKLNDLDKELVEQELDANQDSDTIS